jgi:hypothetical protein
VLVEGALSIQWAVTAPLLDRREVVVAAVVHLANHLRLLVVEEELAEAPRLSAVAVALVVLSGTPQ